MTWLLIFIGVLAIGALAVDQIIRNRAEAHRLNGDME